MKAMRCADLQRLLPKYLHRMPTDPFTGRQLVYKQTGTNWLLYSLGPDRVDNGGKPLDKAISGYTRRRRKGRVTSFSIHSSSACCPSEIAGGYRFRTQIYARSLTLVEEPILKKLACPMDLRKINTVDQICASGLQCGRSSASYVPLERWLSGRKRRFAKPFTSKIVPGVRIPLSPPLLASRLLNSRKRQ